MFSDLPPFLTDKGGLHSGLMMVQVSAAALASENKILASPASVDSIPTSSDKEDHVSMGTTAARKAKEIIENVEQILSMELLASSQGLHFLEPLKPGTGYPGRVQGNKGGCSPHQRGPPFPQRHWRHPESDRDRKAAGGS